MKKRKLTDFFAAHKLFYNYFTTKYNIQRIY